MPNTTRWYEIARNFSPHFTRICFLEIVVETNTRIMRSKISSNFVPSRCITNDNSIIRQVGFSDICSPIAKVIK
jgi:hypothetical protein